MTPHDPENSSPPAARVGSHPTPTAASRKVAQFDESNLLRRTLWTVPEAAFICRVGARTVWRLMADPKSHFPEPRRVRGRTLLARDEVLAYLQVSRPAPEE